MLENGRGEPGNIPLLPAVAMVGCDKEVGVIGDRLNGVRRCSRCAWSRRATHHAVEMLGDANDYNLHKPVNFTQKLN
jgi:hypothetical protein